MSGRKPSFARPDDVRQFITDRLGSSDDIVLREFRLGIDGKTEAIILFLDGMADRRAIDEDLVRPLMTGSPPARRRRPVAQIVVDHLVHVAQMVQTKDGTEVIESVLSGDVALFIAGYDRAIVLDLKAFPGRAPGIATTELALKGSLESFTEILKTNVLMIRRRVQSPDLSVSFMRIGRVSSNFVVLMYIEGVANPALIAEVRRRLKKIDHDAVQLTALLQSMFSDNPWTPFPLYRDTERPDIVAMELLNGRVAIMVDNTPFAVILPTVLLDFFRASDDYATGFWRGTFIRMIRALAATLGLFAIPLYIAFLSFRPELIPTELALAIASSREGIPFPPVVEVVLMLIVVEILREATLRIPTAMGSTLAIVGGLILGTAAADARLVSVLMLIVVALTSLSQFITPGFELGVTLRLLLWVFLAAAATLGLIGLSLVTLAFIAHIVSLDSVGTAYLSPLAPFSRSAWKDALIRAPLASVHERPEYLHPIRKVKTKFKPERHKRPDIDREMDQAQTDPYRDEGTDS